MKRLFAVICVVCLGILAVIPPTDAHAAGAPLRVGLYYGSDALAAPQLQNFEGSGYQAGTYDANGVFHALYSIQETKTVMLASDKNYALQSDGTYAVTGNSIASVGKYHVKLAQSYATATDAEQAAQVAGGYVAYENGAYYVYLGNYASEAMAQAEMPQGGQVVQGSTTGITVAATETGEILFIYMDDGLFAMAPKGSSPITWFKGYKYYGAFVYPRQSGSNLSVINYVDIEDYVKGVVPYEMSPDWNIEALKAQAVCARSEALSETKHQKDGFDVCATVHCQVYRGLNQANDNSDAAVEQTRGLHAVVDNKAVGLFYFSSDGGATEDAVNVWGGDYSYLKGKADPYEAAAAPEDKAVWAVTMTASEVQSKIRAVDSSFGTLSRLAVTKRTEVGNVLEVTATDTRGKEVTISKAACRSVFGLNSQRYTISPAGAPITQPIVSDTTETSRPASVGEGILSGLMYAMEGKQPVNSSQSGNETMTPNDALDGLTGADSYTFSGTGWGHHVGMSQYGAKAMADQGMSYEDIINFYFTGITLEKAA